MFILLLKTEFMSEKKIPYHRKPEELSVTEWQTGLRKQYAKEQNFRFKNMGDHPVYSDFEDIIPKAKKHIKYA